MDHGADISNIRRTRIGDVLIELKSTCRDKDGLASAIEISVRAAASLRTLVLKDKLEIRNIDCCTPTQKVEVAIKKAAKTEDGLYEVRLIKPNKAEEQIAMTAVIEVVARKLLHSA